MGLFLFCGCSSLIHYELDVKGYSHHVCCCGCIQGDTGSDDSNYDNDASATAALDEDTSALDFPTGNSGSGAGIELVVSPIDVGGGVGGSTRRKRV